MRFFCILIISSFLFQKSFSQINFKAELRENNPVAINSDIPIEEAIEVHQNYLNKAISDNDTLKQLYGYLYLYVDYYRKDDYTMLQKCFIGASNLVENTKNLSWKAAICMRKAHLLELIEEDLPSALAKYEEALDYCIAVKDSFCISECVEQLGDLNSSMENYDKAHFYYKEAIVLTKKFAGKAELALTYNNYSNLFSYEGRLREAKLYIDSAIVLTKEINNLYKQTMYESNLAEIYNAMGMSSKAIALYTNCIKINKQHNWADLLMYNYWGIAEAYENNGDLTKAIEFTHNYYIISDSIKGAEVKFKIAKLESENELHKKEVIIEKNEKEIISINSHNERLIWLILFGVIVVLFMLISWYVQNKKNKAINIQHQNYLTDLTEIIVSKNHVISNQEEELKRLKNEVNVDYDEENEIEDIIFNTKILNDADYITFKAYFEKAYPGFLLRVRKTWSDITPAEERLFLLIKLNLKNKDIAEILGISSSSVKKTRNRLRKRLGLSEEFDLDDYIIRF